MIFIYFLLFFLHLFLSNCKIKNKFDIKMEEYIQNGQEINKKVKKRWCLLIVIIIVILIVGIIALIIRKIVSDSKLRAEDQKNMSKSDEELIGTHFYMPRANKEDVDLNLYMHEDDKYYP